MHTLPQLIALMTLHKDAKNALTGPLRGLPCVRTGLSNEMSNGMSVKSEATDFVLPSTSTTKKLAPILIGVMQIICVFVIQEVLAHKVVPSHIDGV